MRRITSAAILLALFGISEAKAQHYSIPRPILMPHQVHDPCGSSCNGNCSGHYPYGQSVTVDGLPYDSSNLCTRSICDELASDISEWISYQRAVQGLYAPSLSGRFALNNHPSILGNSARCIPKNGTTSRSRCGGGSDCCSNQERESSSSSPQPLIPPPIPDEEVDPFLNDPTASLDNRSSASQARRLPLIPRIPLPPATNYAPITNIAPVINQSAGFGESVQNPSTPRIISVKKIDR